MLSDRSQFEVYCPRCEVTFPVGTRICVHCGGATAASRDSDAMGTSAPPVFDFDVPSDSRFSPSFDAPRERAGPRTGRSQDAGEYGVDSGAGNASRFELDQEPGLEQGRPLERTNDDAAETPDLGRSIIGSMGNLIWIALLIVLSLSGRVCGE